VQPAASLEPLVSWCWPLALWPSPPSKTTALPPTAAGVLAFCEIDPSGLTQNHLLYIDCLRKLGGKAGLAVIATMMRLHESVVRELERLLIGRELLTYGERDES
jgi:hypothetical protein